MNSVNNAFHELNNYIAKFQDYNKEKYQSVVNFLDSNLSIKKDEIFPSGSYRRKTRVPFESDIDVLVLVNQRKPGSAKETYENNWKKVAKAAQNVSKQVRAIKFEYSTIHVDLVFAYGKRQDHWYIANYKRNKWETTNPKKNIEVLKEANKANKSKVTPFIRLFKYWNYQDKKTRFKSFHVEAIVMDCFNEDQNLYKKTWEQIFAKISQKLPKYIDKPLKEPAGVGPDLEVYDTINTKLKERIRILNERIKNVNKIKNPQEAILEWKKIVGERFGKKA